MPKSICSDRLWHFWFTLWTHVRWLNLALQVDGKWEVLCNITGNYQRRRVHTLPCAAMQPSGPPAPKKQVVAAGSVSATYCNVTGVEQRWVLSPVSTAVSSSSDGGAVAYTIRSADRKLCLGFAANTSAYGGYGNSVVAQPCGASSTTWLWTEAVGGSVLKLAKPHSTCSGVPGADKDCECAHPVVCTACHGTEVYTPPTSVELISCSNASHMHWSSLQVNDGRSQKGDAGVMLMTGGLCLQAPASQNVTYADADDLAPAQQRVQAKTLLELAAEAAPAPKVGKVRVTVTATNGIADARINEIRLYDAEGVRPFPAKQV